MEFLHGSSSLGAPHFLRLLLVARVWVPLVLVHGGWRRCELLLIGHVELQVLAPRDIVVLGVGRRRLGALDVGVVELDLGSRWLVLAVFVVRALEGCHANHCHGMGFLKLANRHVLESDESVLVEDLHSKRCPKSVSSNGAVLILMTTKWKNHGGASWSGTHPFAMIACHQGFVESRRRVVRCVRPMLRSLDVMLVGRQRGEPW